MSIEKLVKTDHIVSMKHLAKLDQLIFLHLRMIMPLLKLMESFLKIVISQLYGMPIKYFLDIVLQIFILEIQIILMGHGKRNLEDLKGSKLYSNI